MLKYTRSAFLDQTLKPADLTNAADLWRVWFEHDRGFAREAAPHGFARCEAEIYGFAAYERDALAAAAVRACERAGCPMEIDPSGDRDTLVLLGPWTDAHPARSLDAPPEACWHALLRAPALHGLCFSLTISCRAGLDPARCANGFGGDLTLFGVCRGPEEFLVKTITRRERAARMRYIAKGGTSPLEKTFLTACDVFARRRPLRSPLVTVAAVDSAHAGAIALGPEWDRLRSLAPDDATAAAVARRKLPDRQPNLHLFTTASVDRKAARIVSLVSHVPGERGLLRFLWRVLGCLVLAGGLVYAAVAWATTPVQRIIALAFAAVFVAPASRVVLVKVRRARRYRERATATFKKLYDLEAGAGPANWEPLSDDPHPRRFRAEWEAIGARHCFDFGLTGTEEVLGIRSAAHCFVLDADHTKVFVTSHYATTNLRIFPSNALFLLRTRFADGLRLMTSNQGASTYRKPVNPKVVARFVPGEYDPAAVLERHREVVRRLVAEGHQPLPPAGDFLSTAREIRDDHEEARALRRGRPPVTWGDAIRHTFELPHKGYFEPGWPRRERRG